MTIETPIQMRFADVDMLGHVNNVNQQHYLDVGKTDFFRRLLGIESYREKEGLITVATSSNYQAQIRLYEPIVVRTTVRQIGNKSFTLSQQIVNSENQEIKTDSSAVMVTFDFEKQESIPIPPKWRTALEEAKE